MENKTKILNVQPPFNNLELCDTKLLSLWANDKLIQKKGGGGEAIQKISSWQFSVLLKKPI